MNIVRYIENVQKNKSVQEVIWTDFLLLYSLYNMYACKFETFGLCTTLSFYFFLTFDPYLD